MKILITGSTGVLGRAVTPLLISSGHEVLGTIRKDGRKPAPVPGLTTVAVSLFNPDEVRAALRGVNAVMHLATSIPTSARMGRASAWAENDRLRREGTRILVEAAVAEGVARFVYPSVSLVYAAAENRVIAAATGVLDPAPHLLSTLAAEDEVARFASAHGVGVTLRMGTLYGPTSRDARAALDMARRGWQIIMGDRWSFQPHLWIEDAGAALLAALDVASGIYDVVEDRVFTADKGGQTMAAAVGRHRLRTVPRFVLRLFADRGMLDSAGASRRVSNENFKAASRWTPAVKAQWDGWPLIALSTDDDFF